MGKESWKMIEIINRDDKKTGYIMLDKYQKNPCIGKRVMKNKNDTPDEDNTAKNYIFLKIGCLNFIHSILNSRNY